MTITLNERDAEFLKKIEELGWDGQTQEEIAAHFGMSRGQLNYRALTLGYKLGQVVRLGSTVFDKPFSEMLRDGEIKVAKDESAAAATAAT